MPTILSKTDVEHIAELAKLGLTSEETERFREQLSAILEYAEMLEELDVDGIPPTAQVTGQGSVMREDEVLPSLSQEQALANAPDSANGEFKVRPILGQGSSS
jgi:aspartyl-tRNA(Asn)/glutamyl-tRNA(Gln) amidotransferase subunit C